MSKSARRPAAHFLALDDIKTLLDEAWRLGVSDRAAYSNALRVELAVMTGLRRQELHDLRPCDVHDDGTLTVRLGKGAKPRRAAIIGLDESPTLRVLRRFILEESEHYGRPIAPKGRIFRTSPQAWHHWVVYRLGPASGLQRPIDVLNPTPGARKVKRWFIHPHAFRAAFVILCRRYPRQLGLQPVSWETICDWGGWDSVDTVRRHYWYADLDEAADELRRAFGRGVPVERPAVDDGTPRRVRALVEGHDAAE